MTENQLEQEALAWLADVVYTVVRREAGIKIVFSNSAIPPNESIVEQSN